MHKGQMQINRHNGFSTLLIAVFVFAAGLASAGQNRVVSKRVEGNFSNIVSLLREAIQDRGIVTVNTFYISDMLERTAKAYGISKKTYGKAIKIEFCSAKLAHMLVDENPANINICPFSVSIFTLIKDPGHVHLSYLKPEIGDKPTEATRLARTLIDDIIQEAVSW